MQRQCLKYLLALSMAAAVTATGPTGCALYRNDKCWVPPEQYDEARAMYLQMGSLDLVEQRMIEQQWRLCRRNEVLYRLNKEFEVLPEELPAAAEPVVLEEPSAEVQ